MFSGILVKIKKLYDPFLWIRFNCLREAEPLIRHSLLFTIKSPEALGIHLIDIGRVKGWINLGATLWSKFCSTFESIQILRKTDILCKPYSPEFNPSIYFNTISWENPPWLGKFGSRILQSLFLIFTKMSISYSPHINVIAIPKYVVPFLPSNSKHCLLVWQVFS